MKLASRRPTSEELSPGGAFGNEYQRLLISVALEARPAKPCAIQVLEGQLYWLCELQASLSTEQVDRLHPPYTWTIRQVFEHCANAERVFGDRMMRIAAGDRTDLPSWDENAYAESRFGLGNFGHLVSELAALRQANVLLLRRIVPKAWENVGSVGGTPLSVRALAWMTAGHLHHHFEIVERRCGVTVPRGPADEGCGVMPT